MSTASEWAPAAQLRLPVGAEDVEADAQLGQLLSLEHAVRDRLRRRATALYVAGATLDEVGRELGISKRQVGRYLDALGVPRRPGGARRRHPVPEPRACGGCGETFTPSGSHVARGGGRFCSQACKHDGQRVHPDPGERACAREGCEERFRPIARDVAAGHGRYCSLACYHLAQRRYPEPRERPCASRRCGRTFKPRYPARAVNGRGKFCSLTCAVHRMWDDGLIGRGLLSARAWHRWVRRRNGFLGGRPRSYTDEQAQWAIALRRRGKSVRAIADCVGLPKTTVAEIVRSASSI